MLDGLNTINWSELDDAHGPATSIPSLLRGLTDKSEERQANRVRELSDIICHQGSSYSATVAAIPFLLELVCNASIQNRDQILSLIRSIAIGSDLDMLFDQTRVVDYLSENDELDTACYVGIMKGVPKFIELLQTDDWRVRSEAAYLLSWYPDQNQQSLPQLRERLRNAKQANELACLILSVGLLEFQADVERNSAPFVRPMIDDHRQLIRYASALYLFWHDPTDRVMSIIEELSENNEYDCFVGSKSLMFAGYAWNQYAERLLELSK